MIQFTGYDLLWLFFIYSFAGWVLETAAATLMHRKFSNRGLVNGPLCILYGVGAVAMSVGLQELTAMALFICILVCSSYRVHRWKVNREVLS